MASWHSHRCPLLRERSVNRKEARTVNTSSADNDDETRSFRRANPRTAKGTIKQQQQERRPHLVLACCAKRSDPYPNLLTSHQSDNSTLRTCSLSVLLLLRVPPQIIHSDDAIKPQQVEKQTTQQGEFLVPETITFQIP